MAPDFDDARALAEAVRAVVRARTRLSCSLGVANSKVVAKIASDRRKPGGLTVVRPGREAQFLAPFPIRLLPGVGPRAEERLVRAGVETIGGLAELTIDELRLVLRGEVGAELRDRARGVDPRPLERSTERISISNEETFERDVSNRERLHDELRRMSVNLAEHLATRGHVARTVTTKLRYPDFSIRTRSTSLAVGTDDANRIGDLALLAPRSCAARPSRPAAARWRRRLRPGRARAAPAARRRLTVFSARRVCEHAHRMSGYSFTTEIRVRFAETDAQGIVHNANYAVWFEVARVGYLERYAGGYQRLRDLGVEALVLKTHVRYTRRRTDVDWAGTPVESMTTAPGASERSSVFFTGTSPWLTRGDVSLTTRRCCGAPVQGHDERVGGPRRVRSSSQCGVLFTNFRSTLG